MGVWGKIGVAAATLVASAAIAAPASASGGATEIEVRDACDPASFNAAIGPGTCVRDDSSGGRVDFGEFIEELGEDGAHGAWSFKPEETTVRDGASLHLTLDQGGEFHTFTKVARFGPGCIPDLNNVIFGPGATPVPECAAFPFGLGTAVVAPGLGGRVTVTRADGGVQRFQCLIHPWMHTTLKVR